MLNEEELASQNDPLSQISQYFIESSRNYVIKLCIAINILIIWSASQGIISFQIGSIFNSPCLIAFGITSFAQIVIILYIYHKLLTEHYEISLITIRSYFNSRKKTETLFAIFGMIIFIIFAIIITFIAFYVKKQEKDSPKKPLPPGTIPPFNVNSTLSFDANDSRPPWQILAFGGYVILPYLILILSAWYMAISKQSEVWKEATIWAVLFFPIAYIIFINSQLSYFVSRKRREVIFTLIIAVILLVHAIKLGCMYLWSEKNVESEISFSNEIEDLEGE